jgi:hypothetical protein
MNTWLCLLDGDQRSNPETDELHAHAHANEYTSTYMNMHAYMYVHALTRSVRANTSLPSHMHAYMYVHALICMHTCTCIHGQEAFVQTPPVWVCRLRLSVNTRTCVYTCACAFIYAYIGVHAGAVYIHTYIHALRYLQAPYKYIHTYIRVPADATLMDIHTYIHTLVYLQARHLNRYIASGWHTI